MSNNIKKYFTGKVLILLTFIALSFSAKSQMNCEIQLDEWISLPVCYGEEITMKVDYNSNCVYQWSKNGIAISGETSSLFTTAITENNSKYMVTVTDIQTQEQCSDEITITMMNAFEIAFEQTQLTCSNSNAENGQNAKAIATASGDGFVSFVYEWGSDTEDVWTNPNNPQEAIGLKAWKEYYVNVTGVTASGDSCMQTANFTPISYPNPIIKIVSNPKDTAYIQNPYVTFGFEGAIDSIEHNSWSWAFYNNPESPNEVSSTSILENPTNVYHQVSKDGAPYRVELNVKSADYGCDTTFSAEIIVLPVKLKIPNIFTPNGDGINDYFIIDNDPTAGTTEGNENSRAAEFDSYNPLNDYYLRAELTVFNRWGRIVYKSSDYRNDWDGGKLPDATYFYVLECIGEQENHRYQGSVTIFGSGR